MTAQYQEFVDLLRCPACGAGLAAHGDELKCRSAAHTFPIEGGIAQMFLPNDWEPGRADVTEAVRAFYEKTPFPDYDEFDSVAALVQKSRAGRFARLLDEQIPLDARVLEVGCGTGQLGNFLGVARRTIFGTDVCLNSLALAEDFRRKNGLARVGFYQMNLFRPIFEPETFDLVISNGVLHHTSDPAGGFRSIATTTTTPPRSWREIAATNSGLIRRWPKVRPIL